MQFSVSASRRDNWRPGLVAPPQLDAHSPLCDPAPSPPDSKGWTQKPPLAFAYICRFRSTLPLCLANISYTGRNNAEEGMLQWQCILCVSKFQSISIWMKALLNSIAVLWNVALFFFSDWNSIFLSFLPEYFSAFLSQWRFGLRV